MFDAWRMSSMYEFSMQVLSFQSLSRNARSNESPNFCLIRMLKFPLPMEMLHAFSLVTNKSMLFTIKFKGISENKHGVILLYKITFHERLFVTIKVSELIIDSFPFSITLATVILSSDFVISIQPYNVNFLMI